MPTSSRLLAAVSLALALLAMPAHGADNAQTLTPLKDRPAAAEFVVDDIDGKPVGLAALRGRVVLVNFWATWCPPCRREMPSLERLTQLLKNEAFTVLAVNVGESPDEVWAYMGILDLSPTFPILFDRDSAVLRSYPVRGLPTSFILDKSGHMAYRAVGGREFDDPGIVSAIRELIREKGP